MTSSNGAASVAEGLLERAGLRTEFDAARVCGVEPGGLVLTAVHPWDVDGAGAPYPTCCRV